MQMVGSSKNKRRHIRCETFNDFNKIVKAVAPTTMNNKMKGKVGRDVQLLTQSDRFIMNAPSRNVVQNHSNEWLKCSVIHHSRELPRMTLAQESLMQINKSSS